MYRVLAKTAAPAPARTSIASLPDLLAHARAVLDQEAFARILAESPPTPHERKNLDTEQFLTKLWQAAEMLGLIGAAPQRILDIGTGAGHFPFICRALGHDVVALDRGESAFFKAATRWMGVEPVDHVVRPFRKMPSFGKRFDLVTAFRIGFNVKPDRTTYDLPEWQFFLDHIADDLLRPGGRLCLKFNLSPNRGGRKADDPELRALFAERGAAFSGSAGRTVIFDPLLPAGEEREIAAA